MLFVQEDILAKLIDSEKTPTEGFYVELNLRMWLISCCYDPNKSFKSQHMEALNKNELVFINLGELFR